MMCENVPARATPMPTPGTAGGSAACAARRDADPSATAAVAFAMRWFAVLR